MNDIILSAIISGGCGLLGACIGGGAAYLASYKSTKNLNEKTESVTNKNIENLRQIENDKLDRELKILAVKVISYIKEFIMSALARIETSSKINPNRLLGESLLPDDLFKLVANKHLLVRELEAILIIIFLEQEFNRKLDEKFLRLGLSIIFENYKKIFEKGYNGHNDTIFRRDLDHLGLNDNFYEMIKRLQGFSNVNIIRQFII